MDRGVGTLAQALDNPPRETLIPDSEVATLQTLETLWDEARHLSVPDLLLAIGGGTIIDLTKALAAGFANGGIDPVVRSMRGQSSALSEDAVPIVPVPTVLGSGSELTATATIWNVNGRKAALDHASLYPEPPIYPLQVYGSVPLHARIAGMSDIYSHALDSVWNRNATEQSRQHAEAAIVALRRFLSDSSDECDWLPLVESSRRAAMAIAITRTSLSHAVSYPLTNRFGLTHGLAAGFALPAVAEYCLARRPELLAPLARAHECSEELLSTNIADTLNRMRARDMILHSVRRSELPQIAESVLQSERARNFPVSPSPEEIRALCDRAYELLEAISH